jgi:hypothetical protein
VLPGNSGGPVVDGDGYLRGIVVRGTGNDAVYDDSTTRSFVFNIDAIVMVVRHVYGADALAEEILGH